VCNKRIYVKTPRSMLNASTKYVETVRAFNIQLHFNMLLMLVNILLVF